MLYSTLFIIIGFLLLVKGGDFLVDGAVAIAHRARLTPMVIGLTVVGFGTSMPELLVSTQAAIQGSSAIAIGNVAGSNIANIALILGATSIIRPLPSTRQMLRIDLPFMLLAMIMLLSTAAAFDAIPRVVGLCMVTLLILFISWEIRQARKLTKAGAASAQKGTPAPAADPTADGSAAATGPQSAPMPLWRAILLVLISLGAMSWGADLLIQGSTTIATDLGTRLGADPKELERIIGLTVVAVGTSLPELFASVMAARKGETDMAVGNIIGSVTFNILSVIGMASAITPIANAWQPFAIDYAVMLFFALVLWLFLRTHHAIIRLEGTILLLLYVIYMIYVGQSLGAAMH